MNGFIIAGTNSGCGKTTLTTGLMALLTAKGYKVAPFKTGPDFIDPSFHTIAAGNTSYNLDSYLMDNKIVNELFNKHTTHKDVAIIEGVMGMFDGLGNEGTGSTAELAQILDLPVILIVNCKSSYQSIAAIVQGFSGFDEKVKVAGVILNYVSAGEHYEFLKEYIESKTGVKCIGHLPFNKEINLESRHLGLVQASEVEDLHAKINSLVDVLSATIDCELLLKLTEIKNAASRNTSYLEAWKKDLSSLRLGVARDKAFRFYYEDNLELLRENGAQIFEFSPLCDSHLPNTINALYIGGGYPEVFAENLSANETMKASIKAAIENGMPAFAECGGLMYLTNSIETLDGQTHAMCEVFNCKSKMTQRLQRFGYCHVEWQGKTTNAHEFHHSKLEFDEHQEPTYELNIGKPTKNTNWKCGLKHQQALAGYPHIHFYSNAEFYHQLLNLWTQQTTQY